MTTVKRKLTLPDGKVYYSSTSYRRGVRVEGPDCVDWLAHAEKTYPAGTVLVEDAPSGSRTYKLAARTERRAARFVEVGK